MFLEDKRKGCCNLLLWFQMQDPVGQIQLINNIIKSKIVLERSGPNRRVFKYEIST